MASISERICKTLICFSLLLILCVFLILLSASHKRIVSLHDFPHISRYSLCELHFLLDNCMFVSTVPGQYHFYNGGKLRTKALVTTVIDSLFNCPFPAFHFVHLQKEANYVCIRNVGFF